MRERVRALRDAGYFNDFDLQFGRLMTRLAGVEADDLLFAACLASQGSRQGHVCIDLEALSAAHHPATTVELNDFSDRLRGYSVVGQPGERRPLILDQNNRLYLYRYWKYEREVAAALTLRGRKPAEDVDRTVLRCGLARLFGLSDSGAVDCQALAAAIAVLRRLTIVSGGPGTGKTSAIAKLLALWLEQPHRPQRIGLAAPTGKAAMRLQEAVQTACATLGMSDSARRALPKSAMTLHRLLGKKPGAPRFVHDEKNPLPLDALVVDEASMVDLSLMHGLLKALPVRARLVLLGDKDQLASVDAGSVLGDLCAQATGYSRAFGADLEGLLGTAVPRQDSGGLPDSVVLLEKNYRFSASSGIARFSRAVAQGRTDDALAELRAGHDDLAWHPATSVRVLKGSALDAVQAGYCDYFDAVRSGAPPRTVLEQFNRFRVLAALRTGAVGVTGLNVAIESMLSRSGLISPRALWYPGRPVILNRNDYDLRLFNGDVGVAMPDPAAAGELRVYFENVEGALRGFSPNRLPGHETAYAITVHKSQGAEFDRVFVVLPERGSPALSRELLYTAVTRARRHVDLMASADALDAAIMSPSVRMSGLQAELKRLSTSSA